MKLFKKKTPKYIEYKRLRMVILGTMESGKSTLYNQMRLNSFRVEDRTPFIEIVNHNIIHAMKTIATAANYFHYHFKQANQEAATVALSGNCTLENGRLPQNYVNFIKNLCEDPAVRRTLRRRDGFNISDSALYFISHISRICQPDYIPTNDDILRARVATTGFNLTEYFFSPHEFYLAKNYLLPSSSVSLSSLENVSLEFADVGGYRADRKKWIHIFGNTTCITFVVALDDFCFNLFEDPTVNRMQESLSLFDQICNYDTGKEYFQTFILFFNKEDRFKEVVSKVSLQNCFKDYNGRMEYNEALEFIINKFLECNILKRTIHVHVGSAVDSEAMTNMLASTRVHMLKEHLKKM